MGAERIVAAAELSERVFGIAKHITDLWAKIPKTEILNQEASINVPESTVEYSLAIRIPTNLRSIRKKIEFPVPSITRITTTSLSPMPRSIRGAVKKLPSGEGYVLFPKLLPPDSEIISMSITYELQDLSLIDDLVHRTQTHEGGGTEQDEYWMHAQLKHPKVLAERFGRFDLRDVAVTVDVAVHNELRLAIPGPFITRLKIFFDLLKETNPRQQFKVIPTLRRLAKHKTAGREFEIFKDLDALFVPSEFSKFLEVFKDFRYSTCYRGREYFELPIEKIPKKMEVVSRADLTLDKPASDGILLYKRDSLMETLNGIFS